MVKENLELSFSRSQSRNGVESWPARFEVRVAEAPLHVPLEEPLVRLVSDDDDDDGSWRDEGAVLSRGTDLMIRANKRFGRFLRRAFRLRAIAFTLPPAAAWAFLTLTALGVSVPAWVGATLIGVSSLGAVWAYVAGRRLYRRVIRAMLRLVDRSLNSIIRERGIKRPVMGSFSVREF